LIRVEDWFVEAHTEGRRKGEDCVKEVEG